MLVKFLLLYCFEWHEIWGEERRITEIQSFSQLILSLYRMALSPSLDVDYRHTHRFQLEGCYMVVKVANPDYPCNLSKTKLPFI